MRTPIGLGFGLGHRLGYFGPTIYGSDAIGMASSFNSWWSPNFTSRRRDGGSGGCAAHCRCGIGRA
jgi:hypothetical protein